MSKLGGLQPGVQSSFQKLNFDNSCQKTKLDAKLDDKWSLVQFYWISLLCARYFCQDCSFQYSDSCVSQLLSIVHNLYKAFDAYPSLETS